jgi:hypothetical protein
MINSVKPLLISLHPVNYALQQSDFIAIAQRQVGTGEWFLKIPAVGREASGRGLILVIMAILKASLSSFICA